MGIKEVTAGAEWLDSNFPGWEREIDLGTLDINNGCLCVLGQALNKFVTNAYLTGYGHAMNMISVGRDHRSQWAVNHGFLLKDNESIWRELIKERFSTGNLSDV